MKGRSWRAQLGLLRRSRTIRRPSTRRTPRSALRCERLYNPSRGKQTDEKQKVGKQKLERLLTRREGKEVKGLVEDGGREAKTTPKPGEDEELRLPPQAHDRCLVALLLCRWGIFLLPRLSGSLPPSSTRGRENLALASSRGGPWWRGRGHGEYEGEA